MVPVLPAIVNGHSEVLHTDETTQASAICCIFGASKYGENIKQKEEQLKLTVR